MYNEDYYSKENFIKKLNYAVEFRFETYRAFYKAFNDKYTSFDISQAVRSWRSFSKNNANRLPSINQLIQLCNVLDCDMDYFLTEQKELKKDIASASEITGLTYENIEKLAHLKYVETQALDMLISHKQFCNLLFQCWRYFRVEFKQVLDNLMLENKYGFDVELRKQHEDLPVKEINKFYITDGISKILEDINNNCNIENKSVFEQALIEELVEIAQTIDSKYVSERHIYFMHFDFYQDLLRNINPASSYATLSLDELKEKFKK